jgi:hypothetical protein
MQTALQFLLTKQKAALEAQLLEQQVLLAQAQLTKVQAEITQLEAQTALVNQQRTNLIAEALNIPKQGEVLDKQALQITQQTANLVSDKALTDQRTLLTTEQTANAVLEGTVLVAQECKLRAEFDVLKSTDLKVQQETSLLTQKVVTERAQTLAIGVDNDSVIGKQKSLYQAQTSGFVRDAEQKAAKIMVDSWNVRRTTDEGTSANTTNKLDDLSVGKAVDKLLGGIGA